MPFTRSSVSTNIGARVQAAAGGAGTVAPSAGGGGAAGAYALSTLSDRISELTRVVKLSFNLQMDVQRAVRQEVAAALTRASSQLPPPTQQRQ